MSARPSTRPTAGASSEGIDNFQLPKALVTRIAKSALPHDAKLQKETISTLANGATVFINYLAATAQDVASSRSRKTIAGPDILKALELIEFGDLVPLLQGELESYRGIGKADKGKGKAADVKGKEGEPSSAASDTLDDVALPSESSRRDMEPESGLSQNVEEREEGGLDEDIGTVEAGARDGEEEQEEEEDGEEGEEEEEEIDDDVEADAAGDSEDVVDMVAVEEVELRRDQQGLEDPNNGEE